MHAAKILLVDDEADIRDLLAYNLEAAGYRVKEAENGLKGLIVAERWRPDLVILDVMMPVQDGIATCEALRQHEEIGNTPVIFLTARSEDYSELAGFEAGADDYVVKPIKIRILLKRIHALLKRRASIPEAFLIKKGDLEIDKDAYTVRKAGKTVSLTRREFELLFHLASHPGKLFNRQQLLDAIWGNVHITDRTVHVHVRKLREKLRDDLIQTVKGVGYKFASEEE
jgi:two-component system alkaline phosphatase synthesis response regulator PhoP